MFHLQQIPLLEDAVKSVTSSVGSAFDTLGNQTQLLNSLTTTMFTALGQASDKAITGLVKGTETWQQAMFNTIQAIEIKFLESGAKLVLNKLQNYATIDTASTASAQQQIASDQTASDAGIAAQAAKAISSITNDAKEVFGGIFAFLSPTMGPAAAAPAEAGSAAVAAMASGIVYAENGAWNIPSNTLAYLHAGEMVVPQSFASNLRDGGGLGNNSNQFSITIQAIDTQTGAQFLKNNASSIADALSSQMRLNNTKLNNMVR